MDHNKCGLNISAALTQACTGDRLLGGGHAVRFLTPESPDNLDR